MKKIITLLLTSLCFAFSFGQNLEFSNDMQNQDVTKINSLEAKKNPPKMDIDIKFYLPSCSGIVTGNNVFSSLNVDSSDLGEIIKFMIEGRMEIYSFNDYLTFSLSLASGGLVEGPKASNPGTEHTSLNGSLGCGLYFHPAGDIQCALSGLCVYFYPLYDIPLYREGDSLIQWKSAFDLGFSFNFLNVVSIYPYSRMICSWQENLRISFDVGVALGAYLFDRNYYSENSKTNHIFF